MVVLQGELNTLCETGHPLVIHPFIPPEEGNAPSLKHTVDKYALS
jgi:hypothetical protein